MTPALPGDEQRHLPARAAWTGVVILWILFTLSYIDRQILALLVVPIKADLGITDTQFGILTGWTFAIFFSLAGLPAARIADAGNRRLLIGAGVVFWSLATAACGLARSFTTLFLARVGVGVGAATLAPAATSLIADSFPPSKRGRAMATFSLGIPMGSALAFILGGAVIAAVGAQSLRHVPLVGEVRGWQLVFFIVGLPGLALAPLMFLVHEPRRRGTRGLNVASLTRTLAHFKAHARLYGLLYIGLSCHAALAFASNSWLPAFFLRVHGLSEGVIGPLLGGLVMVFGIAGAVTSGILMDRFTAAGRDDAAVRTILAALIVSLPLSMAFPLMPNAWLAAGILAPTIFLAAFGWGIPFAAVAAITPNELRAQATALYTFTVNLLGYGIGPPLVGLYTDYVFGDEALIAYSLVAASLTLGPVGILLLYGVRARFGRQARAVAATEAA